MENGAQHSENYSLCDNDFHKNMFTLFHTIMEGPENDSNSLHLVYKDTKDDELARRLKMSAATYTCSSLHGVVQLLRQFLKCL